ncbi:MAG: hypothetical protein ACOX6P_06335 [Candidatus Merdivicinus sp.]|jgi:hypothetical protein
MVKKIMAFCASAIILMGVLSGCNPISLILSQGFDASKYVKGILDSTYLGEYTDYMETTNATEEEAAAGYESGLEVEAEVFANYFGFWDYFTSEEMDSQLRTDIINFYREVYSHSSYQVKEASKTDSGYTVEVTIQPINIFSDAAEELNAYLDEVQTGLDAGLFDEVSDADFYREYAAGILDICKKYAENPTFAEDITLAILVTKDSDGLYGISDTDFQNLDTEIIAYP